MSNRPYAPSWVDRLIDWIDRLPGPAVIFYVALYLVVVLIGHLAQWIDGVLPESVVSSEMVVAGMWVILGLGAIHAFERATRRALDAFEPAFGDRTGSFAELRYRMTEMPSRTVLVLTLVSMPVVAAAVLSQPSIVYEGLDHPVSLALMALFAPLAYSLTVVLFYVVARTLVMVHRAYRDLPVVNPLRQRPLYALSNLTMKIGLVLLVLANVNLGLHFVPEESSSVSVDLVLGVLGLAMAMAAFVLPLWGIHRRLQDAKADLAEENADAIERIRVQLYRAVAEEDHDRVGTLDRGLASIMRIEEQVQGIPTWPWRPGTFRNFLTAVVLPILVWVSQQILVDLF